MPASHPRHPRPPEVCPVCGEAVPPHALACPECGADYRSGWRDDASAGDGLDLPDADFNYDEFVRQEFGSSARPRGVKPVWWISGILLVTAFIAILLIAPR